MYIEEIGDAVKALEDLAGVSPLMAAAKMPYTLARLSEALVEIDRRFKELDAA